MANNFNAVQRQNLPKRRAQMPMWTGSKYSYDLDLMVYTENVDVDIILSDTNKLMSDIMSEYMGVDMGAVPGGMPMGMKSSMWQEILPGNEGSPVSDLIRRQYDVVYGKYPERYDEIMLVLNEKNEIDDTTLFALGLIPKDEIMGIMDAAFNNGTADVKEQKWSYEEICAMEFVTVLNSDCYSFDKENNKYVDLRDSETGLKMLYSNGIPLKVAGIIRPSEDAASTMLSAGIAYTSELTKYVIGQAKNSGAVKAQQENPETDIISGLPFNTKTGSLTDEEKAAEFIKNQSCEDRF